MLENVLKIWSQIFFNLFSNLLLISPIITYHRTSSSGTRLLSLQISILLKAMMCSYSSEPSHFLPNLALLPTADFTVHQLWFINMEQ